MTVNSRTIRFDHFSWPEAAEAVKLKGSTLIWPFGACEQHGPHLPLITDTLFAERLAYTVLKQLPSSFPIWLLPTQALGFSPEHASFPGTISVSAPLLLQLVMEVGKQLEGMGLRRLLLFNAHGGQIGLLETAARQLRLECPSMSVLPCFIWRGIPELAELIPKEEREVGLHAALAETSLMLSLAPELVGIDRPVDGDHKSLDSPSRPPEGWSLEGDAPNAWLTNDLSHSGVIGDSRKANLLLGEKLEKILISHWGKLLTSLLESNWPPISASNCL